MKPKKTKQVADCPEPAGRVFRLTYANVRPDDDPKLFQCRDAMAFCELNAAFARLGHDYATSIYFYPDDDRGLDVLPKFQPTDTLVLTTRPPLHDRRGVIRPRKKIFSANTDLEDVLFDTLGVYIEYCTRKHVQLTKHGTSLLTVKDPDQWTHIEVYEYCGAWIQRHFHGPEAIKPPTNRHSTIAFFLRADGLPKIDCNFVASFGMDGYGTLIWNRYIRRHHPDWLTSPRFVMAELVYRKDIPEKPITPEFADDPSFVEVRLLT